MNLSWTIKITHALIFEYILSISIFPKWYWRLCGPIFNIGSIESILFIDSEWMSEIFHSGKLNPSQSIWYIECYIFAVKPKHGCLILDQHWASAETYWFLYMIVMSISTNLENNSSLSVSVCLSMSVWLSPRMRDCECVGVWVLLYLCKFMLDM